ncbi:MAG: glycosyltransferase family 4 protein [Lacibacter sp.]
MRIGIEAQRIFREHKHGMDMVAIELIRNLQVIDHQNEYFIFVNPDSDRSCFKPSSNFNLIEVKKSPYPLWEQFHLPKVVKQLNLDLLHCTSNTAPVNCPVPLLITLHDIIYLEGKSHIASGSWYQRLGNIYRIWNVPKVFRSATKIVTVSEFERSNIIQHFHCPPEKVETVYNGVSPHFKPQDQDTIKRVKETFHLPDQYLLFLGNTAPKKNLKGVLAALKSLSDQNKLKIPLVMPDFGEANLNRLLTELNATELASMIHLTGYIPNQQLPGVYAGAAAFIYPSLRESFGLPILEAMACACPVITSNNSSMIEIAENAALLIDPFHPEEIAQAIDQVLTDKELAAGLIQNGVVRAKQFSYRKGAENINRLYYELYNSTRN